MLLFCRLFAGIQVILPQFIKFLRCVHCLSGWILRVGKFYLTFALAFRLASKDVWALVFFLLTG